MKYAYVISKRMRKVTDFDFTEKTSCSLIEYNNGDFEPDSIYSWDKSIAMSNVGFEYASIEELTEDFGEDDVIISSDLRLPDIYESLHNPEYSSWNSSCDVCFEMLRAYNELTETISLEDLIEAMQK